MNIIFKVSLLIISAVSFLQRQVFQHYWNGQSLTDWLSVQPETAQQPSQYFLCGFAFKQMRYEKQLNNCNCVNRNGCWSCNWCPNYFWTMANSFRGIFCNYQDWNKQLVNEFSTGNGSISGVWRQWKCPPQQYASRAQARLSTQTDKTQLGFNGLVIKCQNKQLTQSSYISDDYSWWIAPQTTNRQGYFISSYKLGYFKDGRLGGIAYGFEPMPMVVNMGIQYKLDKQTDAGFQVVDTIQTQNRGSVTLQQSITSAASYTVNMTWSNDQQYTENYDLSPLLKTIPAYFFDEIDPKNSIRQLPKNFTLGRATKVVYTNNPQTSTSLVPTCKSKNIMLALQRKSIPYDLTMVIANALDPKDIVFIKKTTGVFEGVKTIALKTFATESQLQKCP